MGGIFSTPESLKTSSSTSQPEVQQEPSNPPLEEAAPMSQTGADVVGETQENKVDGEGDAEKEEEGECGFCLFMKGGGCKESFVAWEKCMGEAEKNTEDIVDKCSSVTLALTACMRANHDYYGPILRAEKKAEEEAIKALEKEREKQSEESKAETETVSEAQAAKELGNVKAETVAKADAAKELDNVKAETVAEADAAKEWEGGKKESKSEESEPVVTTELGKEGNSCDSELKRRHIGSEGLTFLCS